jgi:hypothetical protein
VTKLIDVKIAIELERLLDYLESDERKDYESREPADRHGHIYETVRDLRVWLNGL